MKRYVIGLLVATVMSAAALAGVIVFLNPFATGWLGPTLFLASLYFLVASFVTLLGFVVRVLRSRKEVIFAHLNTSFRQGLLLALVFVGSLVLQVYRIFNIWSALLFVAAVVLVELAFQSHASTIRLREQLPGQFPGPVRTPGAPGAGRLSGQAVRPKLGDVRRVPGPKPLATRFVAQAMPQPPERSKAEVAEVRTSGKAPDAKKDVTPTKSTDREKTTK